MGGTAKGLPWKFKTNNLDKRTYLKKIFHLKSRDIFQDIIFIFKNRALVTMKCFLKFRCLVMLPCCLNVWLAWHPGAPVPRTFKSRPS